MAIAPEEGITRADKAGSAATAATAAAKRAANTPYNPLSANTPDLPPFNPVAVVVTQNGERIQIDSKGKALDGTIPVGSTKALPSNAVFTPIATIITQNGEQVDVDSTGHAADGSVPIGTTKPVGATGVGTGTGIGIGTGNGTGIVTGSAQDNTKRQSAYDLLYSQFKEYGLESLVEPLKGLITDAGVSPSEFTLRLRGTDQYKKRFAANTDRVKNGLTALNEADYLGLEDQYQNVMRNYGLPASYYAKGDLGRQEGFEKLIANDVSNTELEDRIATAQQRVLNSNPEVLQALKKFYPDISNADILSYALDPTKALTEIKRKVTAAEIGGAALAQGLQAQGGTAESLAGLGITKAQAQQGYADVAGMAPRGSELAAIYKQPDYTQQTAEAEVFGTAGAAEAKKKRQKLTSLEQAQFGGQSGVGALGRDRALYGAMQGQQGQY